MSQGHERTSPYLGAQMRKTLLSRAGTATAHNAEDVPGLEVGSINASQASIGSAGVEANGGSKSSVGARLDRGSRSQHERMWRGSRRAGSPSGPGCTSIETRYARLPSNSYPAPATSNDDSPNVFGPIRSLDARSLAGPAFEVQVPAGAWLVHEGQLVGTFFVIRSGTAELRCDGECLRTLAAGECFGEIEPVPCRPQSYSIVASTPMRLLTFSAHGIARLCAAIPGARGRLEAALPAA